MKLKELFEKYGLSLDDAEFEDEPYKTILESEANHLQEDFIILFTEVPKQETA